MNVKKECKLIAKRYGINWASIFDAILAVLEECQDRTPEDIAADQADNDYGWLRVRRKIARRLRYDGMRRSEAHRTSMEVMRDLRSCCKDDDDCCHAVQVIRGN